ncbi:hypothetical protein E4T44_06545 [Aureobasidium sp. EXF-8845]|nr:hypothetical protein E4T45_10549 [Aureobasidium sp. EXF-8846]KAI4843805.1 hypothetical protein E4T44_06545 [Aureobasidium sp. EXF-8845]
MSASRTALNYAIDHTTLSRLQSLLKNVCDASFEARALVEAQLIAEPTTTMTRNQELATDTGVKRQRYAMCENCKEEFDTTNNTEDDCQYHDGELEVDWDSDTWVDWDQRCHGTIDTDFFDEYPEGFRWECCGAVGNEDGCQIKPHEADTTYKPEVKKRRVWE